MPGAVLSPATPIPLGTLTALEGQSGNQANNPAVATLTSAAGKTAYLSGFALTAAGSTAGLAVNVTVTGLDVSPLTFTFTVPIGVLVSAPPLVVFFDPMLPASGQNVNIVVTLPAGGAGNTNASAVAWGFLM